MTKNTTTKNTNTVSENSVVLNEGSFETSVKKPLEKPANNRRYWAVVRSGLIVFAAVPFVLAVAMYGAGSTPSPVAAAADRPSLVFRQYLVNRGKVPPTNDVQVWFEFKNRGHQPVHITELTPSCGCLRPRLAKRDYQPGEVGKFILRMQTPNEAPGPHEYTVLMKYTDPVPREELLTFRVTLPEKMVTVRPRALMIYQSGRTELTRKIVVTDWIKSGLQITGVKSNSPLVTVSHGVTQTNATGHQQHTILATTAATVPPGRQQILVTITTNHKQYRQIRVPIMLFGPKKKTDTK